MGDAINSILEIIGAYEILNNIIPGAVYIILVDKYTSFHFVTGNFIIDAIIFYFAGIIIGRIGSALIHRPSNSDNGSLAHKCWVRIRSLLWAEYDCKLYSEDNYDDYISAEEKDHKVSRLSLIGDMYRTLTSVCICILITMVINLINIHTLLFYNIWIKTVIIILACVIGALIFRSAYIKQAYFIRRRVKKCKENKED